MVPCSERLAIIAILYNCAAETLNLNAMTLATRVLPLILAVLLAGCSAAIKQRIAACKVGDWQQIGKTDGVEAVSYTHLTLPTKA